MNILTPPYFEMPWREWVALFYARFKPIICLIQAIAIAVLALPKRITRQHKTKQSKVLQRRYA